MYKDQVIAVVIPAHNEQALVGRTVATLPDFVDHVLVIDDGSEDLTQMRAREAAQGRAGFQFLRHESNRGVGAAIVTGYRRALQLGADVAIVVGADAQMDPADMPVLLDALGNNRADYAKGDRLSFPGVSRLMPPVRFMGNIALTGLTRLATGYWQLRDSQCGYTAVRADTLQRVDFHDIYPRYGYPNDLLARLGRIDARVVNVPVRPVYGIERSGIRILAVVGPICRVLIRSALLRLWRKLVGPRRAAIRETAREC